MESKLANQQFLPQGLNFPSYNEYFLCVCVCAYSKNSGYFPEAAEGKPEENQKEVKFIRSSWGLLCNIISTDLYQGISDPLVLPTLGYKWDYKG